MRRAFLLFPLAVCGCIVLRSPAYIPAPPPGRVVKSQVLRVKEIRADYVRARVIYAKEVHAQNGRVSNVFRKPPAGEWGKEAIRAPRVEADVIYAKEIHAGTLEAQEIYAKDVQLGGVHIEREHRASEVHGRGHD